MEEALYDEMYRLEQKHWWFSAKRAIILSLLEKHLPTTGLNEHKPRICDLGCGCGMMLSDLNAAGYEAVGIDANDLALEYCAKRRVEALKGSLAEQISLPDNSIDAALLLDVLEHISEEKAAIAEALRAIKPGGLLICTVPAYRWLWTQRDDFHHHKRRYSKKELSSILGESQNAEIVMVTYMNTFLFAFGLIERLLNRLIPVRKKTTDLRIPPLGLNSLLRVIFASERVPIKRGKCLPFGLSVLAVVRKSPAAPRTCKLKEQ